MNTLGDRVRAARAAAGLSQRGLASRAGVSATAISKYERGLDIPSSAVMLKLARATGRRVDFFLRSRDVRIDQCEFRKKANLTTRQEHTVLAVVRESAERFLEAADLLSPIEPLALRPSLPRISVGSLDEAENAAEKLRDCWSLGRDPIESLVGVLEDVGILVLTVDAPDGFDGLTCMVDGWLPVVAVQAEAPGDRQRLSLAHELGHLVLNVSSDLNRETVAYRFAAAFLVPRDSAYRELGRQRRALEIPEELQLLKQEYGMSMQAWILRARDLGIIAPRAAEAYFRLFRSRGWHLKEPGPSIPPEQPKKLRQLVLRALAEGLVTESKAAELLAQPIDRHALGTIDGSAVQMCC